MPEEHDRLATALADRYAIERELGAGGLATSNLLSSISLSLRKSHRRIL
jgi:hypothetical protein